MEVSTVSTIDKTVLTIFNNVVFCIADSIVVNKKIEKWMWDAKFYNVKIGYIFQIDTKHFILLFKVFFSVITLVISNPYKAELITKRCKLNPS